MLQNANPNAWETILLRNSPDRHRRVPIPSRWLALMLVILAMTAAGPAEAAGGTWSALAHPPPSGLNNALLLGDGSVMCGDGGSGWYRLTPDAHGSYVNGTWTALAATHYTRLFYSSDVLTNGNLYVAGGEYGTGTAHAELYNTLNNTWSDIPQPASNPTYSDAVSKMLPSGKLLQGTTGTGVWIYDPALNTITAAASARNQNEACWVRLTNDSILTIDAFGMQSEHYVPSLNQWFSDGNVPVSLYGYGGELGAGFVLPNGNVFYIGGSIHTAIYTPGASVTAAGSWVAGPDMVFGTNSLGAVDAPSAMMVNGKILCALGPTNGFNGPTSFYEYDYLANSFSQVNGPTGTTLSSAPFVMSMLDLPDGTVLFISGQGSTQLYIYFPDGSPLPAGQPVINSITENSDGSYHLTGTGLNGLSGGAAYGDDWQMDSNYPMVRMTNNVTGNVYYARTYGWSSTSVMTGNRSITTEFSLPPNLPVGTYSLLVSANGNPSAPQTFDYAPPAAPTGLSATIRNTQLRLFWNPVAGATAYNVKRSSVSGAYFVNIATVTGTNFTNTGLVNGTTYYYVVNAVGSGGPSTNSAQLAVAPFGPPPTPTGLTAGPDSYVGVSLAWNASSGATSYSVKRATASSGPYTVVASPAGPNYNDTNVVSGTTYYYVVSAMSAGGASASSAQVSAIPNGTGDVLSGLVGNWRFDEDAGTVAADSSGNNNNGTLVGAPAWISPGRIGLSALSLVDTNQQSVTVGNSGTLNMTAAITLAAWINPVDWIGNPRILQKGNSDNQYRLLSENNVLKFHLNGVTTLTGALPTSNLWTHVAATWNGSTMVIYTNGVQDSSAAASGAITTTTDPLAIGRKNTGTATGDFFNGQMDEVRVYNRALGVSEINTIMHNGDVVPSTPSGVRAAAGNTQAILSWNASPGASSYNLKRSTISGGPYTNVASSFALNYTDAGLTNGTTYFYVVSAINFTNETANSSQVSAKPGIGVNFFADANYGGAASQLLTTGNYTLSQLQTAGALNDTASSCRIPTGWTVVIYQNDNYGGASWTLTTDMPSFSAFSGLNNNMTSCKITSASPPLAPTGLSANAGNAQVTLSWNPRPGAASYNVKRSLTNGVPGTPLAGTIGTSYIDISVANGTTYYYSVSTITTNGESVNSSQVSATPIGPPDGPTGLFATAGDAQVSLTWDAGFQAANYNVKRSTMTGGPYTTLASTADTSYLDTGLTNGTTYYYVVSATNSVGESPDSSEAAATPIGPPDVPTGLTAIAGDAQASLTWNPSFGADSYNVKRSTMTGGPYTTVASLANTNYTDIELTNGMAYYYVVSATNSVGESGDSSEAAATPIGPPHAPTGLTSNAGDAQASLTWQPSFGADSYNVKRSTMTGGPYTTVASLANTNYTDTGLTNGTIYYYVVSATNSIGESADSSEVAATPVPGPIVLLLGPQTNGQFTFQFQGVDGRDYIVEWSTNLADWMAVLTNQTTANLFIFTDTNTIDPARIYRVKQ